MIEKEMKYDREGNLVVPLRTKLRWKKEKLLGVLLHLIGWKSSTYSFKKINENIEPVMPTVDDLINELNSQEKNNLQNK